MRRFIALFTTTYYHACGSCAMAPDNNMDVDSEIDNESGFGSTLKGGVVDSDLCVRGVKGLRIVDASVIPAIPSGPIAAVCMAMAEIAAQKVLNVN
jgi:choline dehydrogenase